jgi:hypothetical protein
MSKIGVTNPTIEEYNTFVMEFKKISQELGRAIKDKELKQYNLPSARWFAIHSNNPNVNSFSTFIEYEVRMMPRYGLSKENAIKYILDLQNNLGRPLKKKDLIGLKNNSIGEGVIKAYWGNFNNMKKELNLPITQENMTCKKTSIFNIKRDIVKLCAHILNTENRTTIKKDDWSLLSDIASYASCSNYLSQDNITIRNFIESIGFNLIEAGSGYNFLYDDEELVKSQYEFFFSNYLRDRGLIFNKDYYRDVRYAKFIMKYNCGYNCDYVINYNNKLIYIEIAGMLRDYKDWYYENRIINNKTRENYKNKLKTKELLLKDNNLNYYILFPSDLNEEYLSKIFN